jgi:hypothetical protein
MLGMNRILILLLISLILTECSISKEEQLKRDILRLNQDNSIVDALISRFDSAGNFETILYSFRNDKDPRAKNVYLLIEQLFDADAESVNPRIPAFYYGVHISLQDKESLDNYKVELLVDPNMQHIKLIKIQSHDNNKFEYNNKFIAMTDELKVNMEKIVQESGSR